MKINQKSRKNFENWVKIDLINKFIKSQWKVDEKFTKIRINWWKIEK